MVSVQVILKSGDTDISRVNIGARLPRAGCILRPDNEERIFVDEIANGRLPAGTAEMCLG
jgi:hypothetical protein